MTCFLTVRCLLARILDSFITSIVALVVAIPWLGPMFAAVTDFVDATVAAAEAGGAMTDQNAYITEMLTASLPITIVSLFVGLLYETVFLVWRGATPGKMAPPTDPSALPPRPVRNSVYGPWVKACRQSSIALR